MDVVKVKISCKRSSDGSPIICISEMWDTADNDDKFLFPIELQNLSYHTLLASQKPVLAATKALNDRIGFFRVVNVRITDELHALYFDELGNAIFNGVALDVVPQSPSTIKSEVTSDEKPKNIFKPKQAEDLFNLKKFDGKSNVEEFLAAFEKECQRYDVTADEQQIEILGFFLKDSASLWYDATRRKLQQASWYHWTTSMRDIFGVRNFAAVRAVYNFKYLSGRFIDYALKKENLILDLDPKITESTRIDMIVLGLPLKIQDQLKREELKGTDALFKELSDLDISHNEVGSKKTTDKRSEMKTLSDKKPCSICLKMDKPDRFHPENRCWFKNRQTHHTVSDEIDNDNNSKNE